MNFTSDNEGNEKLSTYLSAELLHPSFLYSLVGSSISIYIPSISPVIPEASI